MGILSKLWTAIKIVLGFTGIMHLADWLVPGTIAFFITTSTTTAFWAYGFVSGFVLSNPIIALLTGIAGAGLVAIVIAKGYFKGEKHYWGRLWGRVRPQVAVRNPDYQENLNVESIGTSKPKPSAEELKALEEKTA